MFCSNDTSNDYKVDYTFTFTTGSINTVQCIASVDNNMNIIKVDLKIKTLPIPFPFPLPGEIQDVLFNVDITFTKQKCKYQVSRTSTLFKIVIVPTFGSLDEVNAISLIKSGNFKFVKN